MFYLTLCIRTIRIALVIESRTVDRRVVALMNGEWFIITMCLAIFFFWIFCLTPYDKCMQIPFFNYKDFKNDECLGWFNWLNQDSINTLLTFYNFILPL